MQRCRAPQQLGRLLRGVFWLKPQGLCFYMCSHTGTGFTGFPGAKQRCPTLR
jgi:hypothetical protein